MCEHKQTSCRNAVSPKYVDVSIIFLRCLSLTAGLEKPACHLRVNFYFKYSQRWNKYEDLLWLLLLLDISPFHSSFSLSVPSHTILFVFIIIILVLILFFGMEKFSL
jgi:hypothetical protein